MNLRLLCRLFLLALLALLPNNFVRAQDSTPDETVVNPIIVKGSATGAESQPDQTLAVFITTAMRLRGPKFLAYLSSTVQTRPDLAARIVVCALNISRLNLPSTQSQLPLALIDQIVKTAVAAAPESATEIVSAAIRCEPYARTTIVAAAITAAPAQASEIAMAMNQTSSVSMFALASAAAINPVNDGGAGAVNSPEQPPSVP